MKFFVCSDIHGDLGALRKALNAFERSGASQILLLGDLLNHGPRNALPAAYDPMAVSELLNEYAEQIISVRGNCDSEVDQALLNFPVLGEHNQLFIGDRRVFLCHGHTYGMDKLPVLPAGSVFISGHTHVPVAEPHNNLYLFNPGSVAIPRQGWAASYGLLNEHSIQVQDLESDETLLSCSLS
jgi:putative phosphoesterase